VTAAGSAAETISRYVSSADSNRSDGHMDLDDTSLRPHPMPGGQFRWTHVSVMNSLGRAAGSLNFGEPFELLLDGVASADLAGLRVGFSIDSALGTCVFNSFQTDYGTPSCLAQGNVRFRIGIGPNMLAPGRYTFSLLAIGPQVFDFIPSSIALEISTVAYDSRYVWLNYHQGMLRYPCAWYSPEVLPRDS
jgi:hypothetical protein